MLIQQPSNRFITKITYIAVGLILLLHLGLLLSAVFISIPVDFPVVAP